MLTSFTAADLLHALTAVSDTTASDETTGPSSSEDSNTTADAGEIPTDDLDHDLERRERGPRRRQRRPPHPSPQPPVLPELAASLTLPAFAEDTTLVLLRSELSEQLNLAAEDLAVDELFNQPRWLASGGTPFRLTALADGSGWELSPPPNWNGLLSFELISQAGRVEISVEVTPVNDAPLLPPMRVLRSSDGSFDASALLHRSIDVDGDALSITAIQSDEASFSQNDDGSWSVSATGDSDGVVAFTYTVSDGELSRDGHGALILASAAATSEAQDDPLISGGEIIKPMQHPHDVLLGRHEETHDGPALPSSDVQLEGCVRAATDATTWLDQLITQPAAPFSAPSRELLFGPMTQHLRFGRGPFAGLKAELAHSEPDAEGVAFEPARLFTAPQRLD